MRIFITGSRSFIGNVLWNQCVAAGHDVCGVDVAAHHDLRPGEVCYDICDPRIGSHIPDEAVVIHLAAVSTTPDCKRDPLRAMEVNVQGTMNLSRAAKCRGCCQFIFASSEWVYGNACTSHLQTEDDRLSLYDNSLYAITKIISEFQLLEFSGIENVTILRFGIVYGPREKNWSAVESLLDKILRAEPVEVGNLQTSRRFIHVTDLCGGIVTALGKDGKHIVNLAGASDITLADIITTGQHVANQPSYPPKDGGAPLSVRRPDISKARDLLGWIPSISLEQGMRDVAEYLKDRHHDR